MKTDYGGRILMLDMPISLATALLVFVKTLCATL